MAAIQKPACEREQKPFKDLKPGDRFNFMGEWFQAKVEQGIKSGLRLTDQANPCSSAASAGSAVFPAPGSIVTVIH